MMKSKKTLIVIHELCYNLCEVQGLTEGVHMLRFND